MYIIRQLISWQRKFFYLFKKVIQNLNHENKSEFQIRFHKIYFVEKPPHNEEILLDHFFCSVSKGKYMWALFKCPCGCGEVITLSLQSVHNPHWQLNMSDFGRPTISPSIWRNQGCLSHFWITDGRISCCMNSESYPNLMDHYKNLDL